MPEIYFEVNLIEIINYKSERHKKIIAENCTHIIGDFYFFEGDLDFISVSKDTDNIDFNFFGTCVVSSLKGFSEFHLVSLVYDNFNIILNYNRYNDYFIKE